MVFEPNIIFCFINLCVIPPRNPRMRDRSISVAMAPFLMNILVIIIMPPLARIFRETPSPRSSISTELSLMIIVKSFRASYVIVKKKIKIRYTTEIPSSTSPIKKTIGTQRFRSDAYSFLEIPPISPATPPAPYSTVASIFIPIFS